MHLQSRSTVPGILGRAYRAKYLGRVGVRLIQIIRRKGGHVRIVEAQEPLWNVVRQPLGLPLYLVVGLGVSFWGPLNLPDAADLAGGTSVEDAGPARLLWGVARSSMLVAVAAMGAASFLGGWFGPVLPGPVWMILKTLALLAIIVVAGHVLARVRIESFVIVAWVVLIPLALLNVFVSGALLL